MAQSSHVLCGTCGAKLADPNDPKAQVIEFARNVKSNGKAKALLKRLDATMLKSWLRSR